MFERVDAPARFFDLARKQLTGLFDLRQPQQLRHDRGQRLHSVVQIAGGEGVAVGIDLAVLGGLQRCLILRHDHAHDVLFGHVHFHALRRHHQRNVQRGVAHHAARHGHVQIRLPDPFFHPDAQRFVFTHQLQKAAHEFIALILQQLVSASGGHEFALEVGQFHARGVHIEYRHAITYFSI